MLKKMWNLFLGAPDMHVDATSIGYHNRLMRHKKHDEIDSKVSGPNKCVFVQSYNGTPQRFESSRQGQFILAS